MVNNRQVELGVVSGYGSVKIHESMLSIPVEGNILRILSAMKEACSHVTMNGIDGLVLGYPDGRSGDSKLPMVKAILHEIARVVPPKGIAFGMSKMILMGLEQLGFARLFENKCVWQKK